MQVNPKVYDLKNLPCRSTGLTDLGATSSKLIKTGDGFPILGNEQIK